MLKKEMSSTKNVFKPRARLLQQLGDQLIGSKRLAVFELVKNAYDADAGAVQVKLLDLHSKNPSIEIEDNGSGMSLDTIKNIWLVIAHDNREKQLIAGKRTKKGRYPMGSKGLGRLSVHKLGNKIELVTKAANENEVVVEIDWEAMMQHEFLEDALVSIRERQPEEFTGNKTGTKITIKELRDTKWSRGEIRRLYRQVTSISSPFGTRSKGDFIAKLKVPEHPDWIKNLPDPEEILKRAPWKFKFHFDGNSFSYRYSFRGIPGVSREARIYSEDSARLLIPPPKKEDDDPLFSGKASTSTLKKIIANEEMLRGIGPLSGEIYVFDRSTKIMSRMEESRLVQSFLNENGGIRVYRDGIRVYDYGEPNNDWLGLDLRRVNNMTKGLSRNIIVGHVGLTRENSFALKEKSNREGFIENHALEAFKRIVLGILEPLQHEREVDRKAIRELSGKAVDPEITSILEPVRKIRAIASKKGLSSKIDPLLNRIEQEYKSMKERLLSAGISGTSLAVVFHEIEQGVRSLYRNVESRPEEEAIRGQVDELLKLLDGFSDLLRKKDRNPVTLIRLIRRARDLNKLRFSHHDVKLFAPDMDKSDDEGPIANCSFGLTLGALTNIIDNAVFWLRVRWPDEESASGKKVYIGIEEDFYGGPAIIVADNGPGYKDSPADLIRPFYTRRPDGMGMGLYYANMVMELNDGELMFPDHSETSLPDEFDGAIIALRFAEV